MSTSKGDLLGRFAVSFCKLMFACFVVAIFIYSLYLQHINYLSTIYLQGYSQGEASCTKTSGYTYPKGDTT